MNPRQLRLAALVISLSLGLLVVVGCRERGADGSPTIALNWKPEPEFGGLYEAQRIDAFGKHGVSLSITGGPGAPVIQMVAAGQATFGIVSADEVVIARDRGSDIVAVFATYQTSPQGLMTHAARGIGSLEQLMKAGGTLAVEPGLPYVKFLEKKYGFGGLRVVPYTYSVAPFLQDPTMTQQVFVTSEPISARRQGADPTVFLVADSGYDPYTAVVIVRGGLLRDSPPLVEAVVAGLRDGWRAYLDDAAPANALMAKLNPEMDPDSFRLAAEVQKPLIETGAVPVGSMTRARWSTLADQLLDLQLVDKPVAPESCFADVAGDPVATGATADMSSDLSSD
jgi:NitT/TauT family transport system substrate-binding protein